MQNKIRQIKTDRVLWQHIVMPGENEIQYLRDHYQFHPLDLQDCVNIAQRPKVDEYDKYLFLILLFPRYDRDARTVFASEIDFFVGPEYLITVSDGKNAIIDQFFNDCLKSQVLRDRYLSYSSPHLLYEVLHRLQQGIFPMLDHISEDISVIEQQIFSGAERRMVRDILLIKRNIVNFRRIVNAHKSTIRKLMDIHRPEVFLLSSNLSLYFESIIDRSKDIWETLEIYKETINAFQEANDSLISFKVNDAVRILTSISVSLLPATLIAAVFGMNARYMPFVDGPFGFWILLGLITAIIASLLTYFRRREWL